jgi:7,8-dihydro-6-hydroxymethylpterin dimethyltransferase
MQDEMTQGLCPQCLRPVEARIVTNANNDNRVYLHQTCPRHGEFSSLIASDAGEYWRLRQYVPNRGTGEGGAGCCGPGTSCGDIEGGGPPTCVLLLEITEACNLRCPTCYADAHGHNHMTIDEVERRLDGFFRTQNRLDVLMLSGGEPTIHPQFEQILDKALAYPIDRVIINTNGLRLTQKPELVAKIAENARRVELYFSFASFKPDVHVRLYGKDLVQKKQEAMEIARDNGIFLTLVPTVESGVNDSEIGDLYRYALSMPNINGITYQPVMDNGRYENPYDAQERLTLTGTIAKLCEQTNGALRMSDFVGLPCSHPDCCALTYGILDRGRTVLTPLPRHLDIQRYLDLFSDKISFSGLIEGATRRVWNDTVSLRGGQTIKDLTTLFTKAGIADVLRVRNQPDEVAKRVFRVVVKPFMDAQTYDQKRIDNCCTKIVTETGEAVSFCKYNVFHRGRIPTKPMRSLTMVQ